MKQNKIVIKEKKVYDEKISIDSTFSLSVGQNFCTSLEN